MKILLLSLPILIGCANISIDQTVNKSHSYFIDAHSSYTFLGPKERPTGGMMITGNVAREFPLGETKVAVGGGLTLFGLDVPKWMAVLGGPNISLNTKIKEPIHLGGGLSLDCGRVPVCTRWGFCMLYSGFFPSFSGRLQYAPSKTVTLSLVGGARIIETLAWKGLGGDFGLSGVYYW